MSHPSRPAFKLSYLHPKYSGTWLVISSLFSLSLLPFCFHAVLGKVLGRFTKIIIPSRVRVARINLRRSFPDWSEDKIEQMIKSNFDQLGRAVLDTAAAWFWSDKRVKKHMAEVEGLEHLQAAIESDSNILVIAPHFYTIEWHTRLFGMTHAGVGIYRPNNNPVYEYWQHWGRTRNNRYLVDRRDVRGMIRALKNKLPIWYAPDHDYGRKASVFAPFFAVEQASTITGTATLARVKGTVVLPSFVARTAKGHKLVIEAPLTDYPVGDAVKDATRCNQALEQMILKQPEVYMWIHKRFKTRPEGQKSFYK